MARFIILGEDENKSMEKPNDCNGEASQTRLASDPVRTQNAATRAFQCYPIVIGIISRIDLTALDCLARTSMYIHNGLIQYRSALIAATLRCVNEEHPIDKEEIFRYRVWAKAIAGCKYVGKGAACARDLVGECCRCGEVICRNCTIKPPAPVALKERHRRLCLADAAAPLAFLAKPALDSSLPFESEVTQQTICKCDTRGVWLCHPCGHSVRETDRLYHQAMDWRRSHNGEVLGDGDHGVICGREADCIAAKEREYVVGGELLAAREEVTQDLLYTGHPGLLIREESRAPRPRYTRHKVEGSSFVKTKLMGKMTIGACVPELEDERRADEKAMSGEINGMRRSWCGWCWKVIPANAEYANSKP